MGLSGSFDFSLSAGWASASIRDAHMDLDGFPVDLQETTMRATLKGERLDPFFVEVHRGRYQVSASGSIRELFTRPDLDAAFDASGEVADLASLFGLKEGIPGTPPPWCGSGGKSWTPRSRAEPHMPVERSRASRSRA